jgi:hypothetical protein
MKQNTKTHKSQIEKPKEKKESYADSLRAEAKKAEAQLEVIMERHFQKTD